MISAVGSILSALSTIKYLADLITKIVEGCVVWYVSNAKSKLRQDLADAAALSASAETDDELAAASEKWAIAMRNARIKK
jgi:hypothetical protein